MGSEFRGQLAHRQTPYITIPHQNAKLFQKTSHNVFQSRPLGIKIFRMEPHVENSTAQADALQPFSQSSQPAGIRNKLAPPCRVTDQERTGNRNNSVFERRFDHAGRASNESRFPVRASSSESFPPSLRRTTPDESAHRHLSEYN